MKPLKLILLIAFAASFLGCKKYDEGPVISLRTAKARLVNDWVRDRLPIDCILIYSDGIQFFETNTFDFKLYGTTFEMGTWVFEENETVIVLTFNSGYTRQWKIIKLTKKKLWVINKCTLNGDEIESEYQFSPVK